MNEKRKELLTGRARFLWICLVMTALLLMPGCGKKNEYNETSIRILKKGRIENEIIESFGMNYYDAGELRKMLEETVQEYNAGTGEKDRVVLKEIKVEKKTADVVLEFQTTATQDVEHRGRVGGRHGSGQKEAPKHPERERLGHPC